MGDRKLFVAVVGGYPDGAHVEVHDTRFVVGPHIEDCYDTLIESWWGGNQRRFHLDAWGRLEWADGYRIELSSEPISSEVRLWFVNLGGYDPDIFDELHKNVFVVAENEHVARKRALAKVSEWISPHKDMIFETENMIDVAAGLQSGDHIHLISDGVERPFNFEAKYVPIGKMAENADERNR